MPDIVPIMILKPLCKTFVCGESLAEDLAGRVNGVHPPTVEVIGEFCGTFFFSGISVTTNVTYWIIVTTIIKVDGSLQRQRDQSAEMKLFHTHYFWISHNMLAMSKYIINN